MIEILRLGYGCYLLKFVLWLVYVFGFYMIKRINFISSEKNLKLRKIELWKSKIFKFIEKDKPTAIVLAVL
jgi:hypothetical protein